MENLVEWEYDQAEAFIQWLNNHWDLQGSLEPDFFLYQLHSDHVWTLITLTFLVLFLLAFGWRAGLFGLGLWLLGIRALLGSPNLAYEISFIEELNGVASQLELVRQYFPWWLAVTLAGASAYFLVVRLLVCLTPAQPGCIPKWPHRRLAILLIVVSIGMLRWSQEIFLFIGGTLVLLAVGWLTINGLREFEPIKTWIERLAPWHIPINLVLVAVAMAFAWPRTLRIEPARFRDMFELFAQLDGVFVYIVAVGIMLALYKRAQTLQLDVGDKALSFAAFFFAAYLINSYLHWLFIPIPFVAALLLASIWLFRPPTDFAAFLKALQVSVGKHKTQLKDIFTAVQASNLRGAIHKGLEKKLESGDLTPQKYKETLAAFDTEYASDLAVEQVVEGYRSRDTVFAIGEPTILQNVHLFLKYGALLALIPVIIALYQYLPESEVAYPYPLIDLVTFFIPLVVSWTLYAFYFGYYYVRIKGNSGLTKGLVLSLAMVLPFIVYRLVTTQSFQDMLPFIIWSTQVFLFYTLLGLLAVDYRLIRKGGYGVKNLLTVHNLAFLSVYISSAIAALIPTLLAIFSKEVVEVFQFFIETVLPQVPTIGP
jgi:hypothetical protein